MYPRTEDFLSVSEVADEWTRSGPVRGDPEKALTHLIRAFWGDELPLFKPSGTETADRLTFLEGLRSLEEPCGLTFAESQSELPPQTTERRDGGLDVDLSIRVVLPKDPGSWDAGTIERAYGSLLTAEASDYPTGFLIAFRCHRIARQDFGRYCDLHGWPRPGFWFRSQANASTTMTSRDRIRCRQWLRQLATGPKRHAKDEYFDQAKERFATLSRSAFNELWAELMPPAWKKYGRLRGRRN